MRCLQRTIVWMCVLVFPNILFGESFSQQELEFFETKVRPLLIENCYECHSGDAKKIEAGLLLDHRQQLIDGGESGAAIIPGDPDSSLLIQAVRYESSEMPPERKLSEDEIRTLVHWVKIGAPWPVGVAEEPVLKAEEDGEIDWERVRSDHWAWRDVVRPRVPVVDGDDWSRNEIDRFVEEQRRIHDLDASPPADRRTLIRRVYFDMLGVPPSPDEVRRFVESRSPTAYSDLVDRVLASPMYGERWGRHWLDVARYSDGFGSFNDRGNLPNAFRYRDWVVFQLNSDQPYDQFVWQQIAGDLLDDPFAAVGTGLFAIGPVYNSDGGDPDSIAQAKSETLDDRVDTLSRAFLGLTVACARCHDHKFDPIPTLDYYSIAGVFNNSKNVTVPLAAKEEVDAFNDAQTRVKNLEQAINAIRKTAKQEKRDLTESERERIKQTESELIAARRGVPEKYPECHALTDSGSQDMHVALRGNLRKPGPIAPRRFLRVLSGPDPPEFDQGSGRKELADCIASPTNPLTARVIVNRLWQHHFGRGIVATTSNFGFLGERPSHPQLLDWLASELVDNDWSLKFLHRKILLSATYQMSSRRNDQAFEIDGDNRWLWRFQPQRLDVESWRDAMLVVTGEIDLRIGGPPIDRLFTGRRRTIYAKISRSGDQFEYDEFLRIFDFPTPRSSHGQRTSSTVPQQYLFMMNSQFMVDRATALANRLQKECSNNSARIRRAYALLFGREPSDRETDLGIRFLRLPASRESKLNRWQQYAQALLSSNEFLYVR